MFCMIDNPSVGLLLLSNKIIVIRVLVGDLTRVQRRTVLVVFFFSCFCLLLWFGLVFGSIIVILIYECFV